MHLCYYKLVVHAITGLNCTVKHILSWPDCFTLVTNAVVLWSVPIECTLCMTHGFVFK